jgi:hypothetical protein
MLARLLALLDEGRLHTVEELAASLAVSPEMVDAMLADLRRRGLLAAPAPSCGAGCAGCPLGDSCSRVSSRSGEVAAVPPRGSGPRGDS